jgi:hypothetical protein
MQYFYDGQIRRYLTQIIRLLSNFVVRYGDGTLVRVPVMYGDVDRQAASIINQNSENTLPATPKIAVYVTDFDLARDRLGDATYVGKMHFRERAVDEETGMYTNEQGRNYTVERLMPTPFTLTVKVDIWSANTEQKLQILEQILVLFNPSLEIQTTDNYVDWTSLSVVELGDVVFSSRTIPTGTNSAIDVASLTLTTPVWISPPVKVKKLGIVTNIINNIFGSIDPGATDYIDGLGVDPNVGVRSPSNFLTEEIVTVGNYDIFVEANTARLINNETGASTYLSWKMVTDQYPGTFTPGLSKIYLIQADATEVVGTLSIHPQDDTVMVATWDTDTFPSNNYIDSAGNIEDIDVGYSSATGRGTFDAVIDPSAFNPKRPNKETTDQPITAGIRYLIIESIGGWARETFISSSKIKSINTGVEFDRVYDCQVLVDGVEVGLSTPINRDGYYVIVLNNIVQVGSKITYILTFNEEGPTAWKNTDGSDFIAAANDIIEWKNNQWNVIFSSYDHNDIIIYQTNFYTTAQYKWNGVEWVKSFEGEYKRGQWRISM